MSLKLCYIWVKDYRNFRNAGFNFKHDVKFNYNHIDFHFDIQKETPLDETFFGRNDIEVTGLIGRNGSGKSNVLELVCLLLKGAKMSVSTDFIVLLEENNSYSAYTNLNINQLNHINPEISFFEYNRKIDPLKIIYFSNVFDGRAHNFDKDVSDISNNYRYPRERYPYSLRKKKSDIEKQLEFIESEFFNILAINTPEELRITNKLTNKRFSYVGDYRFSELNLEEFIQTLSKRFQNINPNKTLYYLAVTSSFIDVYNTLKKIESLNTTITELKRIVDDFNIKGSKTEIVIERLFAWVEEVINSSFNEILKTIDKRRYDRLLKSLLKLKNNYDFLDVKVVSEGSKSRKKENYLLQYHDSNQSIISILISILSNKYFDIGWTGISSGHKAYLNLFSLLYSELKSVKRQNTLICIDEGDLYLHPQWQIEFFDKLMQVVPEIYHGNLQFILTSHSPFLLSDLPKQNVTIIDENSENGGINGVSLDKETFAGNLYALYSEPFFLGNNRTSVFAKKKIESLIERLSINTIGLTNTQRARFEKEINLIGDEVIRMHLLKKLNND
ncbi:AAA family ATPase [Zobellia sp. 1_MG-2023]|uniref:AAA family ATPase n=1 Tax=Zobellia sp. 1_MG-2023 TaxID=3062626 RepID=UPI0026E1586E|nr:AAA family ATPase [Zobellia sp. 1_MG-2023]MDO6818912.1 AAA family ATPase [Zobellia sp. 1_MG-2023]